MKTSGIISNKGIDNNFKTIVLEVLKQVEDTLRVLEKPSAKLMDKINNRDDYIDNLKTLIENKCFYSNLRNNLTKKDLDIVRAVNIITNNLEHIADYAVNIVSQMQYLDHSGFILQFNYNQMFREVIQGLELIEKALKKRDINLAFKICRSEHNIDTLYETEFQHIMEELRTGKNTENFVTVLFILRYLERMGDQLLNIGEAIIFAVVGEKLKISHLEALEDSMENADIHGPITNLTIESFLETKSGCRINKIQESGLEEQTNRGEEEKGVIFKEGQVKKLEQEHQNIQTWEKLVPGLPPRVFGFHKNGKTASILLEFLKGTTLQKAILESNQALLAECVGELKNSLMDIWSHSKKKKPICAHFIEQTNARLQDIFRVHPDFKLFGKQIGRHKALSFSDLLNRAGKIEEELGGAPFSVLIHGDFNIDNIIYNPKEKQIHFIDLHRSCQQDYVQDLSIFLISNFRLPVFVKRVRKNLNKVALEFLATGREFAEEQGDKTFEARLALGLVRSFTTSTRFEFNKEFATNMFLRAVYLLEKLIGHGERPWEDFRISEDVLVY